jgi:hypothetical protein
MEGSAYNRDVEEEYHDPEDLVNIHLLEQRRERSESVRNLLSRFTFLFVLIRVVL